MKKCTVKRNIYCKYQRDVPSLPSWSKKSKSVNIWDLKNMDMYLTTNLITTEAKNLIFNEMLHEQAEIKLENTKQE